MKEEVGSAESEVPLRKLANDDGHLEPGGQPEPQHNCRECYYKIWIIGLVSSVLLGIGIGIGIGMAASRCPDGWVGYGKKCYYFAEAEGNWTYSRSSCSSLGASLAVVNTMQELNFMMRYKDKTQYWIGLQREPGQPWKWIDGTKLNDLFTVGGDGDCAYLNDENKVSSLRCTSKRKWICSKSLPL